MSDKTTDKPGGIKGAFKPGSAKDKPSLFMPDEMDIYCNKITLETFIFHGKELNYDTLDYMEYDHKKHTVDVFMKDGTVLDLGAKIQWLLRPYFSKSSEVQVVRTVDRKAQDGTFIPLKHKNKRD